jgi:phage terminase small subunit
MLSQEHARFVREYLIDGNASRAYREAYPDCTNPRSITASAWRLLRQADVASAIQSAQLRTAAPAEVTVAFVIARLKEEAEFRGEGSSHAARVQALIALGKHLALFTERIQVEERKRIEVFIQVVTDANNRLASEAASLPPEQGAV